MILTNTYKKYGEYCGIRTTNKYEVGDNIQQNEWIKIAVNQKDLSIDSWIKNREVEVKMIAQLIKDALKNDQIIELSDSFYIDSGTNIGKRYPTIGEAFCEMSGSATVLTPNLETFNENNLTIVKTTLENPFGKYSGPVTPTLLSSAQCFVSEKNISKIIDRYKTFANMGVPCVYALTGQHEEKAKRKFDEAYGTIQSEIKDTGLMIDSFEKSIDETESVCGVHIIRRRK